MSGKLTNCLSVGRSLQAVSGNQSAVQAQLISLQARQGAQAAQNATSSSTTALPAKLAKNKRLPATMITPAGQVDGKKKGGKQVGKKQRKRSEEGKEKAVERSGKLEERVKGREDRKVSLWKHMVGTSIDEQLKRKRAKQAWE